ncbi:MAG: hypothetical protein ACAI35_07770 [Candidatus Methylacidiphilales bacterium]|nr:hypothetical protein [Candidatus Methylacidiphilales bacterium]
MSIRNTLGDFNSILCFKAVITGVEDTLGSDGAAVVFTRAGRVRGSSVAREMGLSGKNIPLSEIAETLNGALGKDGTRLCAVKSVREAGNTIEVETVETVCSAGEALGSDRNCTFTLGVIWGALEEVTGQSFEAKHTASVLRGAESDLFVFNKR